MTLPTTFDFAQLKLGDAAGTVFTLVCGLETTGINETANTSDSFVRDCAAPATPPKRKVKVTGTQWDVRGTGLANAAQIVALKAALGLHRVWQVIPLDTTDPATPAGVPLGVWEGTAVLTARNIATVADGFATLELTLAGEDDLEWTPEE